MSVEAKEWDAFLAGTPAVQARAAAMARHRQAAQWVTLKMEDVLASEGWPLLKLHQEQRLAQLESAAASEAAGIAGDLVGDELLRAKLRHARLTGRIEQLREDLALPATLQQQAAESVS